LEFCEYLHQAPKELGLMEQLQRLYFHFNFIVAFQLVDVHRVEYVDLEKGDLVLGLEVLYVMVVHH
jgi:hypothetical protein